MNFHVGQKVVCIPDPPETWREWFYRTLHPSRFPCPVVGHVYTVSRVSMSEWGCVLELQEVFAPEEEYWGAGFLAVSFRPVVERKTDISIFTAMLKDEPVKERQ